MLLNPSQAAPSRWLAWGVVRLCYSSIVVEGLNRLPVDSPILIVAGARGSTADPFLLSNITRRLIHFPIKPPGFAAGLFGPLFRIAGVLSTERGSKNTERTKRNLDGLAAAAQTLARRRGAVGVLLAGKFRGFGGVFLPRMAVARLALEAFAAGARDLCIVPIALDYEHPGRLRPAVIARVGDPIAVAGWLALHGEDDLAAQHALASELERRLNRESVEFEDPNWEDLRETFAALLRQPGLRPDGSVTILRLRKDVVEAIHHFHRTAPKLARAAHERLHAHAIALRQAGLSPDAPLLTQAGARLVGQLVCEAAAIIVDAILAAAGLFVLAVPLLLSRLATWLLDHADKTGRTRSHRWLPVALSFIGWHILLIFTAWACLQTWEIPVLLAVLTMGLILYVTHWLNSGPARIRCWLAQVRLALQPVPARRLREEHAAVGALLLSYAAEWQALQREATVQT